MLWQQDTQSLWLRHSEGVCRCEQNKRRDGKGWGRGWGGQEHQSIGLFLFYFGTTPAECSFMMILCLPIVLFGGNHFYVAESALKAV